MENGTALLWTTPPAGHRRRQHRRTTSLLWTAVVTAIGLVTLWVAPATAAPSFDEVQYKLYNALTRGLGLSRDHFALMQTAGPVHTTEDLWRHWFDLIPPESIFQDSTLSPGRQFFSNYCALWSALHSTAGSQYEQVVPAPVRAEFENHVAQLPPRPLSDYPMVFRQWAFLRHPSLANVGASALANALLDPILGAQFKALPYCTEGDGPKPEPEWSRNADDLTTQLAGGSGHTIHFDESTVDSTVTDTWSKGKTQGLFGLWGSEDSRSSSVSSEFAEGFSVDASFGHVVTFMALPGNWFSSAGLAAAHANPGSPPWLADQPVTWQTSFSPTGTLARFVGSLVVVDSMNIVVRSESSYSADEQQVINEKAGKGLWPFYTTSSQIGLSSDHSFDNAGHLVITVTSQPGVPTVLGINVLGIDEFV